MIRLKRVYETPAPEDGLRVLVERLWPRGLTKEKARVDLWLKDVAPSPELRKWYGHDPAKWEGFIERYEQELTANPAVDTLLDLTRDHDPLTFVYAASDSQRNSARLLKQLVEQKLGR